VGGESDDHRSDDRERREHADMQKLKLGGHCGHYGHDRNMHEIESVGGIA
jgi:hypothetical protein